MDLDFQPENLPPKPLDSARGGPPPTGGSPSPGPTPMVSSQPAPTGASGPAQSKPLAKKSRLPILLAALGLVVVVAVVLIVLNLRKTSQTPATTPTTFETFPEEETPPAGGSTTTTQTTTLPSSSTPAGRDAKRKEDIRKISTLLAAYFSDNQSYPISSQLDKSSDSTGILAKALVPKYTAKLPVDPLDPDYFYGYLANDGKSFELSARLEDSTDKEAVLVGSKYLFILKK